MLTTPQQQILKAAMSELEEIREIYPFDDTLAEFTRKMKRLEATLIKGRTVEYTDIHFEGTKKTTTKEIGIFHEWANQDGEIVGIIEKPCGQVILRYAHLIKFML